MPFESLAIPYVVQKGQRQLDK